MDKRVTTGKTMRHSHVSESDEAGRVRAVLDTAARDANLRRLRRASGHIDLATSMAEADRDSREVIEEITEVRTLLQAVARDLFRRQLTACHDAAAHNGKAAMDEMYQELIGLMAELATPEREALTPHAGRKL